jgi:hypothetical protein
MSHSTAFTRVRNTLYIDNPSEDWDGLAGNKIYFVPVSQPCNQASCRACINIEYWVRSTGCNGVSCQWFTSYYNSHDGANDYLYAYVRFKTSHISGSTALYRHVINHETGHILGLKDPNYTGHCMTSVMHSIYYGCSSNLQWPSSGDRSKVTNIANKVVP